MSGAIGQGAEIAVRCDCGSIATRHVGQFVRDGELGWDTEFTCEACDAYRCEGFGSGAAPVDIREALLARHGPVRLRLAGPVPSLVPALKVIRETSAVSLPRARELVEELGSEGLAGTLAEMEFLKARLQLRGIPADIDPSPSR